MPKARLVLARQVLYLLDSVPGRSECSGQKTLALDEQPKEAREEALCPGVLHWRVSADVAARVHTRCLKGVHSPRLQW